MDMKKWMNDPTLKDKRLQELTIPGTHDSGTYSLNLAGIEHPISKTQTLNVADQLNAGIRFFDIRVNTDDMTLNHGRTRTEVRLKGVLEDFKKFLKETDETIIMHVKHEWGDTPSFHTKMIAEIKAVFPEDDFTRHVYMRPMRLDGSIPTLSNLRGKLVYMRRYGVDKHNFITTEQQDGPMSGIPVDRFVAGDIYNSWSQTPARPSWQTQFDASAQRDWPDNEGNFDYKEIDFRNRHGLSFVIQDWYSTNLSHGASYSTQCEGKIDVVKKYLAAASQKFPDSWFLNFVSVTQTAYDPIQYAVGDDRCNNRLLKELRTAAHPKRYGTIILDFCAHPTGLVEQIVNLNF
jgi:hypothetical protein